MVQTFDFNPSEESPHEVGAYWSLTDQADDYLGASISHKS